MLRSLTNSFFGTRLSPPTQQTPLETVSSAIANVGPTLAGMVGGGMRYLDKAAEVVGNITGTERGGLFGDIAKQAEGIQAEGNVLRPQNPANPTASTIGGGAAQGLGLLATAAASVPALGARGLVAVPAALGFGAGGGEGVQQAEAMGLGPVAQLATGTAFGAAEAGTEALGGIGGAFLKPAKTVVGRAIGGMLSEGIEEPAAGMLQEAITNVAALPVADPQRPGFTTTGFAIPGPAGYLDRRTQEAIGGLAGGVVFAGAQLAAERGRPGATSPPPLPATAPAPVDDLAGVSLGDLTAADVADLEQGVGQPMSEAPPVRQPILTGVPDRVAAEVSSSESPVSSAPPVRQPILTNVPDAAPMLRATEAPAAAMPDAAPDSQLDGLRTQEVPVSDLRLSKDVPQFKSDADEETGVVEPLAGKYQRLGTGPILVWERLDGSREVISGRHRFDLAKRTGEQTIPAQVVREADGFTVQMAVTADAELNIRDGHGKTKDFANYFRASGTTDTEAESRGLLARAAGKTGWAIGTQGSQELFDLHQNGRLTDLQAAAVARTAPGNEALQRAGIAALNRGTPIDVTVNLMRALELQTGPAPTVDQMDLFGADDSMMLRMEQQAKKATEIQRGLKEQVAAVQIRQKVLPLL